jgi:ribosomal protein L11 methyltransferase
MSGRWLQTIRVTTTREAEDAVAELLGRLFAHPASVHTDLEKSVTRAELFLPAGRTARREELEQLSAGLAALRAGGLDPGPGRVVVGRVRREDWAESWKRHFKPLEFGSALLLKPGWSRRRARPGQAVVVLDPGLSFGTGQHATTSFCLRQLVARRRAARPGSFLDIGTGSGILAIAAVKLGYRPVAAFDFDPDSVRIAGANARRNRVAGRIQLRRADLTRARAAGAQRFDLVCANLTADLLVSQAARILHRLAPGGTLVLAGILESQFAAVRACYEGAGLRLRRTKREREWRSGAFTR